MLALPALILAGCASTREAGYEPPSVLLTSFGLMPSDGLAPRFTIGLRVINPNRESLKLRGMSYTVALEGHRMLTGVTSKLADVPPYSESEIEINAAIDLLSSIRLFNEIMNKPGRERLVYDIAARLDVEGMLAPLRLVDGGELTFSQKPAP